MKHCFQVSNDQLHNAKLWS